MEIIVVKHHQGLGTPGEIKHVAAGYAQNFLIPAGLAVPATPANRAHWRAMADHAAKVQRQTVQTARQAAKKLSGATVGITAPAADQGTLFAAVSVKTIVAALAQQDIIVSAHELQLPAPIKHVGEHIVCYQLASGDHGSFSITVRALQP